MITFHILIHCIIIYRFFIVHLYIVREPSFVIVLSDGNQSRTLSLPKWGNINYLFLEGNNRKQRLVISNHIRYCMLWVAHPIDETRMINLYNQRGSFKHTSIKNKFNKINLILEMLDGLDVYSSRVLLILGLDWYILIGTLKAWLFREIRYETCSLTSCWPRRRRRGRTDEGGYCWTSVVRDQITGSQHMIAAFRPNRTKGGQVRTVGRLLTRSD